jgi:hypothetical protein
MGWLLMEKRRMHPWNANVGFSQPETFRDGQPVTQIEKLLQNQHIFLILHFLYPSLDDVFRSCTKT